MLYGLGAGGGPGVTKVLEIIHTELQKTMGLCGTVSVDGIGRDNVILEGLTERLQRS